MGMCSATPLSPGREPGPGDNQQPPHDPTTAPLTRLGHLGDGHPLLACHEAQDGEDGKAGHEAGAAVEEAEGHAVPGGGGTASAGGPGVTHTPP